GGFPTLVPEGLFDRVQALLDGKGRPCNLRQRAHPDFPLRRFVACSLCLAPLTGSWSRGRSKRYAYYHCPKCRTVKVPRGQLETSFIELLETLQPQPEYIRLFKAIVSDVWKSRQGESQQLRLSLQSRIAQKRQRLDRL